MGYNVKNIIIDKLYVERCYYIQPRCPDFGPYDIKYCYFKPKSFLMPF